MGKKGRKFIDKKNSVTFHLVHRSQQDPLVADDEAPQRVLKQVTPVDSNKRKEEQREYGIYYDDDYDYMQHLKGVGEFYSDLEPVEAPKHSNKIKLPSEALPSLQEEEVGLLNKAAPHYGPRLDWDPDIVAALDDDFDFDDPDNQLEDDFVALANEECEEDMQLEDSDVDSLDLNSNSELQSFTAEETRSRYSHYSLSSSVLPRNDKLQLLDNQFDKLLDKYEDDHLGALEEEEVEGELDPNSDRFIEMAEEFMREKEQEQTETPAISEHYYYMQDDEEEDQCEILKIKPHKLEYDCESILSTYSNLYNHPKVIPYQPIKISHKTGIPVNVHKRGLTKKDLEMLDKQQLQQQIDDDTESRMSRRSTLSMLSQRDKGESPEERKLRKQALREYRKSRRQEKKENTNAFKQEKKKQVKQILNMQQNLTGLKIV